MSSHAKQLHSQAEEARESGNLLKALELTDQATVAYQEERDIAGMAEIQASRFSTLKHLYQTTGDRNYLILAKHAAQSGVDIARADGQSAALGIPLFNLGKALEPLEEYSEAIQAYQQSIEALEANPDSRPNLEATVLDIKGHLYACQYKNGDKSAGGRAEQTLLDLEKAFEGIEEDQGFGLSYLRNVWVSGAHMRLALILKDDQPEKAREHLEAARKIIDADERMVLRRGQLKQLGDVF